MPSLPDLMKGEEGGVCGAHGGVDYASISIYLLLQPAAIMVKYGSVEGCCMCVAVRCAVFILANDSTKRYGGKRKIQWIMDGGKKDPKDIWREAQDPKDKRYGGKKDPNSTHTHTRDFGGHHHPTSCSELRL
jgi:hypothetical protein